MTTPEEHGGDVVKVRRARAGELAAAGEVTVTAYQADGFAPPHYVDRLRDAATRDREAELWLAVDDESAVLGCVTYCPPGSPWREIAVDDSEGEFRMLAVAPAARGRGVGRTLIERCLERTRELGQPRLVLCSERGMAAAQRLYARFGFTRLPERDWSPVPGVDLLAYGLDL